MVEDAREKREGVGEQGHTPSFTFFNCSHFTFTVITNDGSGALRIGEEGGCVTLGSSNCSPTSTEAGPKMITPGSSIEGTCPQEEGQ